MAHFCRNWLSFRFPQIDFVADVIEAELYEDPDGTVQMSDEHSDCVWDEQNLDGFETELEHVPDDNHPESIPFALPAIEFLY